jgi:RimJ/RimL family protein N-acetyltransferase
MNLTRKRSSREASIRARRLGPDDRARILDHFLALDAEDRSLRFGTAADDAALARYAESIDFERDALLGIEGEGGTLSALAHVAFHDGVAELGLSVARDQRDRGLASELAAAALRAAQDGAAREFRLHCAASNEGMRRIARGLGMAFEVDGSDVIARRALRICGARICVSPPVMRRGNVRA